MSVYTILRSLHLISLRNKVNLKIPCACYQQQKYFSAKAPIQHIVKEVDPATGEVKKKKTAQLPKITLLSGDSMTVTTLPEAEKLSKRRDLKLVKLIDLDTKTQRPVYKLMSGAEYHAEEIKQREDRKKDKQNSYVKGEKVLILTSRITQHDLETQVRKAIKWVDKMYEVRVVINGSNSTDNNLEKVYLRIEELFKKFGSEAKLVQKRVKGTDLKFQILPPKKKSETESTENDSKPAL